MKIFFSERVGKKLNRRFLDSLHDHIEFNYLIIIVLILLFALFIFSLSNFVLIFKLRQELTNLKINSPVSEQTPVMKYFDQPLSTVTIPGTVNMTLSTSSSGTIVVTSSTPDQINQPEVIENVKTNTETNTETKPDLNARATWQYNVFSDGFSNPYYVDMGKTNFRYDETATSFSFKPLYEKRSDGACSLEYCGFLEKSKIDNSEIIVNQKYCLLKNSQSCLDWDGSKLNYNGSEIKSFSSNFTNGQPAKVSIYALSNYWLVGAVWNENGKEIGRAWRFDGNNLSPLDPENRVPFITREGYSGTGIYFGGDDNNYLVLYSGYDIMGYQIVDNTLWNVTDFFNTRLADRGFAPQIIKSQQGKETVWYICSFTSGKPKLIKMWQNGSKIIRGLLSLGEDIYTDVYSTAVCREGTNGNLEIAAAKKGIGKSTVTSYSQWTLIDKGFDQSLNYQAVSVNLASTNGEMKMANFSGLSLCGADSCGSAALCDGLNFTISNNTTDFKNSIVGQEYLFTSPGNNLIWRLKAFSDSSKNYYSPWFGGINSVYYAWED